MLMRTRERVDIHRFEHLEGLLVMAFLHLQYTLHELYFILEGGVGVGLQVSLQIAL